MSNYSKVCRSCGTELPGDASKCYKCGTILEWKRNAFVSVWLWLCIIVNSISLISLFSLALYLPGWYLFLIISMGVLSIAGFVMLLSWKRAGFGYVVSANVAIMLLTFIAIEDIDAMTLIQTLLSTLVLFGVLQCTKDNVSYWDAMKLKAEEANRPTPAAPATPTYTYKAPETPTAPVVPTPPVTPATPEVPAAPAPAYKYATPTPPVAPAAPVAPEIPAVPEVPAAPVAPEIPAVPEVPVAPVAPEVPAAPEGPKEIVLKAAHAHTSTEGMNIEQVKGYFREILQTEFPEYAIVENMPVVALVGNANDNFKLYETRPYQAYKAEWGAPYSFVLYKEGSVKGIVMIGDEHRKYKNVKLLISRVYAEKVGVPYMIFYADTRNELGYVITRINKYARK